jgi:hypothetical protein
MIKRTLFHELIGDDPRNEVVQPKPLTPDSVNYFFNENGYVMEYYPFEEGKIIVLFFGPMELILMSHLVCSRFQFFDDGMVTFMKHGDVFRLLRRDPDFARMYREAEHDYRKKVAERLYVLRNLGPRERFMHLLMSQSWVLEMVKEKDVANYLNVSVKLLRKLKRDEWRRPFVSIPYL